MLCYDFIKNNNPYKRVFVLVLIEMVLESELVVKNGKIYHLGLKPEQIAKNIFVVGDPGRVELVSRRFDKVITEGRNREYFAKTGTYQGMPVMAMSTGMGTDNVEIALVELYGLNEFDLETRTKRDDADPMTIIRLGTSGGLQEDIEVGTLAISDYSIGLDSTGLFYQDDVPDDIAARIEREAYRMITDATPDKMRFKGKIHPYVAKSSPEVVSALAMSAVDEEVKWTPGITITAPGFFCPQGRDITGLEMTVPYLQEVMAELEVDDRRTVNFEMESSLLFHLGESMGYRTGTMCPIIANRPAGTFLTDYHSAVEDCIDVGLKAMLRLYRGE